MFLLLALQALVACGDAGARVDPNLKVEATPGSKDGHLELQFSISNPSSSPVSIEPGSLPWGSRAGALVAGVRWDPGKRWDELESLVAGEDPSRSDPITIAPGSAVQGALSLDSRIQNLGEALRGGHVVVFWFCEPRGIDRKSLGKHGGFIVIPKGDFGDGRPVSTGQGAQAEAPELPIEVEASPRLVGGRAALLQFSIGSASRDPIQVDRGDLPWDYPPSAIVVAGVVEGSRVIESVVRPREVPYGEETLLPGEALVGLVPLYERIGELDSELGRSDVVVFWLYEGKSTDGRRFGRRGGFVVFPKRNP